MLLPLLLATATFPSAPTPRIVPDVLRQDPRIQILARGGHLLPRDAKTLTIQVQSMEKVRWQVRPLDPRTWVPQDMEGSSEVYSSTREEFEPDVEEGAGDEDLMAAMGLGAEDDLALAGAPKRVWPHQGKVSRPRDSLTTWTFRLNLDSLARLLPGKLVSVKVSAAPRDFLPYIDTSVCDTAHVEEAFLVSRLGLFGTALGSDSVEILAVDLDKNRPWTGVSVRGSGKSSSIQRTGPDGTVRLATKGSDRFWLGTAEGREVAVLSMNSQATWTRQLPVGLQMGDKRGGEVFTNGVRTFPYIVRGIHSPGDTVVVGCLVRAPGGGIPQGHRLAFQLCHGEDCTDSVRLKVGPDGHVQWRTRLSKDAMTGQWEVVVQSGHNRSTVSLRVEELRPPRMKISILPMVMDTSRGTWGVEFSGTWLSGRPVEGSSFQARIRWSEFSPASAKGSGDTTIAGTFDATGRFFFQRDSSTGSGLSWIANLSAQEAGGHRVEQELRGTLKTRTQKPDSVIKKLDKPARSPMAILENIPEKAGYAFPEEVSPTDLSQGDTARIRWEAFEPGLALRQVVQGDRILSQSFQNVRRGLQVWKEPVDSTWVPRAHMVVSFLAATASGTSWVRANGRTFEIQPRDSSLDITILPDSVFHPRSAGEVVVRNSSKLTGSMVVSAVDEGILMIDDHRIGDPSGWFEDPEKLSVSWWDGLGRCGSPYFHEENQNCSTTDGLLGEGRMSGIGGIGSGSGGRSGFGAGSGGRRGPRTFLEANPMAWVSRVLALVPGDQTVTVPVGAYTGSLRISVVAVSGMRANVADTFVPVRSAQELKISGPLVVSPGDTFEVITTLLATPGSTSHLELAMDGPAKSTEPLLWTERMEQRTRADHRTTLIAGSTGSIRAQAQAARDGDTSIVPLAVEVKDDRNVSTETLQQKGHRNNDSVQNMSSEFLQPTGNGQEMTFVLDKRFHLDSLSVRLEATTKNVLGMDRRLRELIGYPHGCLEQTLSRAIPQLYLAELFPEMSGQDRNDARGFVKAAVVKLRTFQQPSGLLSLWPYESTPHEWGSLWALDFLQEYHRRFPNEDHSLRDALQTALDKTHFNDPLHEAYRLALRSSSRSGKAISTRDFDTLSAKDLPANSRWMLSRAWLRAGNKTRAKQEVEKAQSMVDNTPWRSGMGSSARDRALALETLTELGDVPRADSVVTLVAKDLASTGWSSTHELGAQFRALAKALGAGAGTPTRDSVLIVRWDNSGWKQIPLAKGRASMNLPKQSDTVKIRFPNSTSRLSAEVVRHGRLVNPLARRDSGLVLRMDSIPNQPLREGRSFHVQMSAYNRTGKILTDLATTLWLPGGWGVPREQLLALRKEFRHVDIRADRVVFHFDLDAGANRLIRIPLVALQAGSYRGPEVHFEALYDGALFAGWKGDRVKILR
jgi:uncharacterized protein YfaS (alpha-2-macroglobulin family)